jgi:hypothetical protein
MQALSQMPPNPQMTISVVPTPYVKPTQTVAKLQVRVMNLILFTSVSVNVALLEENNTFVDSKSFLLEGTDYTSWNNDDTYIVNYVLTQLGMTQQTPVATA